jgi:hypothetical protein
MRTVFKVGNGPVPGPRPDGRYGLSPTGLPWKARAATTAFFTPETVPRAPHPQELGRTAGACFSAPEAPLPRPRAPYRWLMGVDLRCGAQRCTRSAVAPPSGARWVVDVTYLTPLIWHRGSTLLCKCSTDLHLKIRVDGGSRRAILYNQRSPERLTPRSSRSVPVCWIQTKSPNRSRSR